MKTNCTGCGLCCLYATNVRVRNYDNVPEELTYEDCHGRRWMQMDGVACKALDKTTLRCSIYEQRPQECRDFEVGGVDCLNVRIKHDRS